MEDMVLMIRLLVMDIKRHLVLVVLVIGEVGDLEHLMVTIHMLLLHTPEKLMVPEVEVVQKIQGLQQLG